VIFWGFLFLEVRKVYHSETLFEKCHTLSFLRNAYNLGLTEREILETSMAKVDKGAVSLQELIVSSLTQTDAVAKLLIEKGVITEAEFKEKLKAERATYQGMLKGMR